MHLTLASTKAWQHSLPRRPRIVAATRALQTRSILARAVHTQCEFALQHGKERSRNSHLIWQCQSCGNNGRSHEGKTTVPLPWNRRSTVAATCALQTRHILALPTRHMKCEFILELQMQCQSCCCRTAGGATPEKASENGAQKGNPGSVTVSDAHPESETDAKPQAAIFVCGVAHRTRVQLLFQASLVFYC